MISAPLFAAFLLTPFGAFILLLMIFKKPFLKRKYVFFVGLLFGLIGYCTKPVREIDISRYFQQLDSIRNLPFSRAANWADDGLIIKNTFFWLISKLGDNQLLPFFCLLVIYSIVTYILADALSNSKAELFGRMLILLIMLIPFYNVFSNVRNVTAFALLELAVYRDLYKRKRDIWLLLMYILPCYIHMAGFVIVLIRLSVPLIKKMSYLGVGFTFGIPTAIVAFYPRLRNITLPGNIGKVISRAIWKSYAGIIGTSAYAREVQTHGSFIANRMVAIAFCVALMYLIIQYHNKYRFEDQAKYEYSLYIEIITIIGFMLSLLGVVKYWVFMYLVYISFVPILVDFAIRKNKRTKAYNFVALINMIALVRALLQVRTMLINLDISGFLYRILFTNYIVVVLQIIKGLLIAY